MTTIDELYVKRIEAENDKLRLQNEELQYRVCELQEAVGTRFDVPMCFPLTRRETELFGVLMQRELATKEMILTALYGGMDEPCLKIVDVFVCKMRKKLNGFGIEISTLWGRGYYLSKEMKARVREYAVLGMAAADRGHDDGSSLQVRHETGASRQVSSALRASP